MKISESTEIVTKYIPKLVNEANIPIANIKTDCATSKTGSKRADILIADVRNDDKQFDKRLIAVIEVKKSSAKYLDIYESDGCLVEEIKDLIEKIFWHMRKIAIKLLMVSLLRGNGLMR